MKNKWNIIGVMSGTSLDGVDIVYTQITFNKSYSYNILAAATIPYSEEWKQRLRDAFHSSALAITKLNLEYGRFLGKLIIQFIAKHQIEAVDFIASHGHTIFHNPLEKYTLQIGDGASIAETCKKTVVYDFRSADVAKGGQGAPLVPMGDLLLFSEYDYCINIGGFANISFDDQGIRKAFDICPANTILNHYTQQINLEYDDKGKLARSGKVNQDLLLELNNLSHYKTRLSMGIEMVKTDLIPLIDSYQLSIPDILSTAIEHIAVKISEYLAPNSLSLISGGGALNTYLIERIRAHTQSTIVIPEPELIHYKEALIFALLGLLRMENKNNILASVTGVESDHSSGIIYTF